MESNLFTPEGCNIIPAKIRWLKLPGKFPVGMRIPPLKIQILLESNPLKSRILVRRLAVPASVKGTPLFCEPWPCNLAAETAVQPPIWCSERRSSHMSSSGFVFTSPYAALRRRCCLNTIIVLFPVEVCLFVSSEFLKCRLLKWLLAQPRHVSSPCRAAGARAGRDAGETRLQRAARARRRTKLRTNNYVKLLTGNMLQSSMGT